MTPQHHLMPLYIARAVETPSNSGKWRMDHLSFSTINGFRLGLYLGDWRFIINVLLMNTKFGQKSVLKLIYSDAKTKKNFGGNTPGPPLREGTPLPHPPQHCLRQCARSLRDRLCPPQYSKQIDATAPHGIIHYMFSLTFVCVFLWWNKVYSNLV